MNPLRDYNDVRAVADEVLGRVIHGGERYVLPSFIEKILMNETADVWRMAAAHTKAENGSVGPVEVCGLLRLSFGDKPKKLHPAETYVMALCDPFRVNRYRKLEDAVKALEDYWKRQFARRAVESLPEQIVEKGPEAIEGFLENIHGALSEASGTTVRSLVGERVTLSDWRAGKAAEWLLEGFLLRSGVAALSAAGGLGKSHLTLLMAAKLAAGAKGSLLDAWQLDGKARRILIIEAENGLERMLRRIREMVMGGALTPAEADAAATNLCVHPAEGLRRRAEILDNLDRVFEDWPFDALILDPWRSFLPTDMESDADNLGMGTAMDTLVGFSKRSKTAVLVVAHDNRSGQALRGASSQRDGVEVLTHLVRVEGADMNCLRLEGEKLRDAGGSPVIGLRRICYPRSEDGLYPVSYSRARELEIAPVKAEEGKGEEAESDLSWREREERVLALVASRYANGGASTSCRQIEDDLGFSKSDAGRVVHRLVSAGRLYRPNPKLGVYPPQARPEDGNEPPF